MASSLSAQDIARLRREKRAQRRQHPPAWRKVSQRHIIRSLCNHPWYWRASRIAMFAANDGEPDLEELLAISREHRKSCYLPRIIKGSALQFLRLHDWKQLHRNRFGIPEPLFRNQDWVKNWSLDLVLTPLVAFDSSGNRLGMGGGYYDRAFAFRRDWKSGKPRLLGLAWQDQQVPELPRRCWDVPLDGVLTENGLIEFTR